MSKAKELPRFFLPSIEASLNSDHPEHKLGATIYSNGKPISIGVNYYKKTHPKIYKYYSKVKTVHAEVNAAFKVKNKNNLKGSTIVVFRQTKDGCTAMSRPCDSCMNMLKYYGVRKVVYTTLDGYKEEIL